MIPTLLCIGAITFFAASPLAPVLPRPQQQLWRLKGGELEADALTPGDVENATTVDGSLDSSHSQAGVNTTREATTTAATHRPRRGSSRGALSSRGRRTGRGSVGGRGQHAARRKAATAPAVAPAEPTFSVETATASPDATRLASAFRERVVGVVLWADVADSAVAFALGNALFALSIFGPWSAASVLGTVALYTLLLCLAVHLLSGAALFVAVRLGIGAPLRALGLSVLAVMPSPLRPNGQLLSPDAAATVARAATIAINQAFDALRHAASAQSKPHTLLAIGGAYVLKTVGGVMGTLPLAWALFMLAFALPKLAATYADTLKSAAKGARLRLSQLASDVAQGWTFLPKELREMLGRHDE